MPGLTDLSRHAFDPPKIKKEAALHRGAAFVLE
jgi:hypothetical protein